MHNFRGVSTENFLNHFLVKYIGINFALIFSPKERELLKHTNVSKKNISE